MYIIYFINQNGNTVGKWEVEELPRVGGGIVLPKDIYFIESLAEEDRKNDNIYIKARVIDILSFMKNRK